MKSVLMLLADGVEECEALMTRDVLIRAGIKVVMKSIMNKEVVISQSKLLVKADTMDELSLNEFDGVILPGGGLGTQNLDHYEKMDEILNHFFSNHKLVAAICAAPMVLGHRGYLKNKRFTCFKTCEEGLDGIYTGSEVEIDGNIITSRSMYYASDFALEIVNYLLGNEIKNKVANSIRSL